MIKRVCFVVIACLVLVSAALPGGAAWAARGDDEPAGSSFLTPFPANDVYSIAVVGDEYAEGLLFGLQATFQGDTRLNIRPRVYTLDGLSRGEFDEQILRLDEDLKREPADIVIIMVGARDLAPIRDAQGKRYPFGSKPWRQELSNRGDRLLRTAKQKSSAIYWVSLPIVRRFDANEDVQNLNDFLRERVYLNGAKFIDAYTGFADENGGYSAYGRIRPARSAFSAKPTARPLLRKVSASSPISSSAISAATSTKPRANATFRSWVTRKNRPKSTPTRRGLRPKKAAPRNRPARVMRPQFLELQKRPPDWVNKRPTTASSIFVSSAPMARTRQSRSISFGLPSQRPLSPS